MTLSWDEFEALRAQRPRTNSSEAKLRALQPGVPTLWGTYRTHKTATDPGRRASRLATRLGLSGMVYAVRATADGRFELWVGLTPPMRSLADPPRTVADRMSDAPPPVRGCECDERAIEVGCPKHDPSRAPAVILATPRTPNPQSTAVPPLGRNAPSRGAIAEARRQPLVAPREPSAGPHAGPHTQPATAIGREGAQSRCVRCETPIIYIDKRWRTDRGVHAPSDVGVTDEGECWKTHCDGRVLAGVGERLARCNKCGDITER